MHCIQTDQLNYRFSKKEPLLHNINLRIPTGAVYGFLGPNGAGKTTTLKLLLGLLSKQEGTIQIFGKAVEQHRTEIQASIGSLIETPSLYSHLTARENVQIWQKLYHCPNRYISKALGLVGLSDVAGKRTGTFSLGMKQRLGIAIALLPQPSLLILDEPTNGLDPNGISEIRELLLRVNREQNVTIVVSSHLLSEVEKLASHVGILHKGSLLFQGTLPELHARQHAASVIHIHTDNPRKALEIALRYHPGTLLENEILLLPGIAQTDVAVLNRQLVAHQIGVYRIDTRQNDLESIFMQLITR